MFVEEYKHVTSCDLEVPRVTVELEPFNSCIHFCPSVFVVFCRLQFQKFNKKGEQLSVTIGKKYS